ncbi:DUF4199 domain-containing protein [Chitinophaga barathri]|uniref:DUF4199 domain-containing protein n=1 Tax=Chitinophaga barathri TaxID=1647451 RepID=A0A3N4MGQ6_9BACT|nr:DUF4199 domain-containing protein [Chitinophaga barathri]RPD43154.1 DUF4199 domain-containing protein [Chitinophaga barathri]
MRSKIHIRFGLLAAAVNFALLLIQFFAGISVANPVFRFLPVISLLILVMAACLKFSKDAGGEVTFGEVFGTGFRTTAVTIVIFAILFIVFVQVVPAYKERFIQEAVAAGPNGASSENPAEDIAMLRDRFTVSVLSGIILMNFIPGLIASVIGAAIAKKK